MDQVYNEPLLEAYDLVKMYLKDQWEQEQLNELEGFVVLEQLMLIQGDIEQLNQTDAVEKLKEEKQQQRNHEELIQLEQ
jgi:hypothetical protein